jgi:multidrug resistance protein
MNKNPLVVIFLTVFVDLVGFGIIIPLSPFLARQFGASAFEIGLLMAAYSGMQFIFSPFWGGWSDRLGRRPILLLSIGATALSHLLFYFSTSLWMLFVARALAGLFSANISTASAFIADVTPAKDRSKNMGLIGAAFGLGFVLGPALGGIFAKVGDNFPALLAALISGANFVAAYFFLPESLAPENRRRRERKSRIKDIAEKVRRPVVGTLLVSQFIIGFAMASMEATLFLDVSDRYGWSMEKASYGFAYVGICIAFTQGFLVRKLLPAVGERRLLLIGMALFATSFLLTSASVYVWILAVAMTLLALGNGLLSPALTGSLSLLSSPKEQGEILGVNQSLAALARIFGPPVGGFLYAQISMASPFLFAATIGFLGFGLVWINRAALPTAAQAHAHRASSLG